MLMMWDVNLDLKDFKDGAQVMLRGRMFQCFGPITAKDLSKIDLAYNGAFL